MQNLANISKQIYSLFLLAVEHIANENFGIGGFRIMNYQEIQKVLNVQSDLLNDWILYEHFPAFIFRGKIYALRGYVCAWVYEKKRESQNAK